MRSLLLRGLLVGLAAGVLAFVVAYIAGEPAIDRAIAFEEAAARTAGEPPEEELVSRATQSTWGLLLALVLFGVAVGGFFSFAFAIAYGRASGLDARGTALALAVGAFLVLILIPSLAYPANPPAVGDPETIDRRTLLYFVAVAISAAAAVAALRARADLAARLGAWNGTVAATVGFAVLVAVALAALPAATSIPKGFPADVLWDFRLANLATHLVLWSTIGLGFGALTHRAVARPAPPAAG